MIGTFNDSDLETLDKLYDYPNDVNIFKVRHVKMNEIFCLKKVFVQDLNEANSCQRELFNLIALNHPNILKLISYWLGGIKNRVESLNILTEYLEEGDLEKKIRLKKSEQQKFSEEEIIRYLKILVDALAYMQEKNFAHRDIKPSNIFLCEGGNSLKLGDLGSSILKTQYTGKSIVGTPNYLSPILRKAYQNGNNSINHNIFKSDVFSLGLTILHMCSSIDLAEAYNDKNLKGKISPYLIKLKKKYKYLEPILRKMLRIKESKRCDFLELKEILNQMDSKVCSLCTLRVNVGKTFGNTVICDTCINNLIKSQVFEFEILHTSENHKYKVNQDFMCPCGEKMCFICKEKQHEGISCFGHSRINLFGNMFKCPCGFETKKPLNTYFITCSNLVHCFCVVCGMRFNERNHEICSDLYCHLES